MVLFEETQKFRQLWLWSLLAITSVTSVSYLAYIEEFTAMLTLVPVFGLMVILFDFARLKTEVTEDRITIKFFPFHLSEREIKFDDIESFEAETYSPIAEFGGWGVRWIPFRSKIAYNVSGNKGVRITKKNGKEVVIGSQRSEELEKAIAEASE